MAMSPRSLELGPLELQILGCLNTETGCGVADVQSKLKRDGNDLAYTTVLTVLSRLYKKGHLKRAKVGRQFLYLIAPEMEKDRRSIFDRVRASIFRSDRLNPILALLDSSNPRDKLTTAELKELKRVVDGKLKSGRDKS